MHEDCISHISSSDTLNITFLFFKFKPFLNSRRLYVNILFVLTGSKENMRELDAVRTTLDSTLLFIYELIFA